HFGLLNLMTTPAPCRLDVTGNSTGYAKRIGRM
ncbi:MAG: hypothetical protein ACI9TH_004651, partial [Kiritimatiellia bacterium]